MNEIKDIKLAVIGGDMRMLYCAGALSLRGFEVAVYGFDNAVPAESGAVRCRTLSDALNASSAVILPVPYSVDGCRLNNPFSSAETRVDELLDAIRTSQLLLAGVCRPAFFAAAEERGITLTDYMNDEALAIKNAAATAEGAVAAAIRELPVTLRGVRVLVTGYGRVGAASAALFRAVGCDVTVCARKPAALAAAYCAGCRTADMKRLCRAVSDKELIINTVPEKIIDGNVLSGVSRETLIIDLASAPGGVDDDAARHYGVKVCHELSLPGKVSPKSAGVIIADAVTGILEKRNVI